jgi:hypothetical protein
MIVICLLGVVPAVSLSVSSSGITEECPGEENAQSPTAHHLFDFFFTKLAAQPNLPRLITQSPPR